MKLCYLEKSFLLLQMDLHASEIKGFNPFFLPDFEKAAKASERTIDNITKEDSIGGGVVSSTVSIRFSFLFSRNTK